MKRLLILLLSAISLTVYAQQKKVAVYVIGQQSGITKVLGDQLVVAFVKSGKYDAIERTNNFLAELSKEQSYQHSGAVSDNDIARLGVQFGVNYVCVADMSDVFGEKYISARLIDVETAVILNAHNVSGKMQSMDDCLTMASEIASKLSDKTIAEQCKEEELAIQARQTRMTQAIAQGYMDLGLPSGTLWKNANEGSDAAHFTYDEAVSKFGNRLPTYKQLTELKDECTWTWTGNCYKVTGPNGNSITFPAAGMRECDGDMRSVGRSGFYWSSTPHISDSDAVYFLFIYPSGVSESDSYHCDRLSVRLVQKL